MGLFWASAAFSTIKEKPVPKIPRPATRVLANSLIRPATATSAIGQVLTQNRISPHLRAIPNKKSTMVLNPARIVPTAGSMDGSGRLGRPDGPVQRVALPDSSSEANPAHQQQKQDGNADPDSIRSWSRGALPFISTPIEPAGHQSRLAIDVGLGTVVAVRIACVLIRAMRR